MNTYHCLADICYCIAIKMSFLDYDKQKKSYKIRRFLTWDDIPGLQTVPGWMFFSSFYDHTLHYEINKITHTLVIMSSIWLWWYQKQIMFHTIANIAANSECEWKNCVVASK